MGRHIFSRYHVVLAFLVLIVRGVQQYTSFIINYNAMVVFPNPYFISESLSRIIEPLFIYSIQIEF